jgi:hypothetical protein
MNVEDIAQLLAARPFVPFRMGLSDGSSYQVDHPESVLLTRHALDLGTGVHDLRSRVVDKIVRISPLHIVKVETLQPAVP